MKKLQIAVGAVLLIAVLAAAAIVGAVFAADGYTEISTAAELKKISSTGHYRLTADIAFTDGTTLPAFSGKLDGGGKKITGLTAPLFEELSGSVSDLTLTGSITDTTDGAVGVLANTVAGDLSVSNLVCDCPVTAKSATGVGGFIGRIEAEGAATVRFTGCVNRGDIDGSANAAGFVGSVKNTASKYTTLIFDDCQNYGNVHMSSGAANIGVGGLVGFGGRYSDVRVERSANYGDIASEGGDNGVGGIYGGGTWSNGDAQKFTARYTVNTGDVTVPTGRGRAGGIGGRMNRYGSEYVIEYCYNTGTITSADDSASGIFGYGNSSAPVTIRYCYSSGSLQKASRQFPIAGHGAKNSVVSKENYYLNCTTNHDSENVSATAVANVAALNEALLALPNSPYVVNPNMNGGMAILAWQCDHSGEKVENCLGHKCAICGTQVDETGTGSHKFGGWIVDKPATELEEGEEHRVCSVCGEVEKAVIEVLSKVTPVDGVYTVKTGGELIYVFNGIEQGDIPAGSTIRLAADIDVKGGLSTLKTDFTGVLDGNGKTLSGLSQPLFTNFKGRAKSLTMKGSIDLTGASLDHDTARKAASFAQTADGATLTDVISEVDVATDENDLNAGGLVGYALSSCSFVRCAYNGTFTAKWAGDGAGVGGIVGWSNALGGTSSFVDCSFDGKITVTGGGAGSNGGVGGIIGYCTNSNVILRRCLSYGEIDCQVSAGTDYAGGMIGLNKVSATTIENCANKGDVKAASFAGGILGGILDNTEMTFCANYGRAEADVAGALAGTAGDKTLTAAYSADFSENGLELCGTELVSEESYASDRIQAIGNGFTFDGVEYQKYNIGLVEKETGLIVPALSGDKAFTPYISIRDDGAMHSVRIVILTDLSFDSESVTVSIVFRDEAGKTVKTMTGTLAASDGDFTLYSAVLAGGEKYFAAPDHALFGCVITEIPADAWASLEVSAKDTASGGVLLNPVTYALSSMQLTLENLPSYESLGDVAETVYNAGPGLASDEKSTTNEDSFMAVISNTTADALALYVKTLEERGYEPVSKNTLDGDTYYTYAKFDSLIYLYHNYRIGETRIIVDNASDPLSEIAYSYTKKAGDYTALYQYSLNYSNANRAGYDPIQYTESGAPNNGMCYIIKLPDNKLCVFDSGAEQQSTAKSRAGLLRFMREITGTPEGEKVDIALWFFTHAHGDHTGLAGQFLKEYHDEINLEATAFNFPSYQLMGGGYDEISFTTKEIISTYWPDAPHHKLHCGESFSLAGVLFEVVYTHEDAVSPAGTTEIGDFNASSTVLKITFDGKSFMLLGDISGVAEAAIIGIHSPAYLKTDIVQVAHHCFNYLDNLYPLLRADIALFPQSNYNCTNLQNDGDNLYKYRSIMEYATQEYFAHKETHKLTVGADGKIVVEKLPRYDQVK